MAHKPKAEGASQEASALLSTFIAKVAPPRQRAPMGSIACVPMPATIPSPTPDQMMVETVENQLRTMAQNMPEAVAVLDSLMPSIMTEPAQAKAAEERAEEREALVVAVEQVCKDRGIKWLSRSKPNAKRLRPHIIARLREMKDVPGAARLIKKPPGVTRLINAFKQVCPNDERGLLNLK